MQDQNDPCLLGNVSCTCYVIVSVLVIMVMKHWAGSAALHGKQRIHAGCGVDWEPRGVWRHRHVVPLPPRPFQLLADLVHHAKQVVPQSQLFEMGWGESRRPWDLYAQIHHLRQVIVPDPQRPRWLVTRHGGGYLLHVEILSQHA